MAAYTTIDNPELYFQVKTWTGTGSSNALTLDGSENMQPDYVAIKQRSSTQQWNAYDSIRGVQKYLGWNTTGQEETQSQGLTAFGSDGFTVGTDDMVNGSSATYVAYCWKAGTAFSNDASATSVGNTDSNGTASSTAGFSIAKWVGAGAALDIVVKHGLSAAPAVMITKNNEEAGGNHWAVYHHANTSNPETDYLKLSATTATTDEATIWADTAPTSTVFTAGDHSGSYRSGDDFVGYFWNEVQGFSKFGSFSGTGSSATYAFVYLGFRPAWVMIKKTNSSGSVDWFMFDNKRSPFNAVDDFLKANTSGAEGGDGNGYVDFLSNGFKLKTANIGTESGGTFVYMAFAEAPFVNSNGVPVNAR